MPQWKKLIVSGSAAELLNVTASAGTFDSAVYVGSNQAITGNPATTVLSGSFSGSFEGSVNINLADLTAGNGIVSFTYDGNSAQTVALDTGSAHFTSGVRSKLSATAYLAYNSTTGNFTFDSASYGTFAAGNGLTSTNGVLAVGAGTGITVNANDVAVNYGSTSGTAVEGNTTITITGTGNEIEITGTSAQALGGGPSYQIGLPNNVTIGNNLTVTNDAVINGDLIVRGTASFEDVVNLEVADRFILLASGSSAAGDGGIVIQQAAGKQGAVFAFDGVSSGRWGIDTAFSATASAYTPAAFMAAVIDIGAGQTDSATYQQNGNIKIDSGDIYIYA